MQVDTSEGSGQRAKEADAVSTKVKSYFHNQFSREEQQRTGVTPVGGRATVKYNPMDEQHSRVFMAILNIIRDKDQNVQRAVLEPIADKIVKCHDDCELMWKQTSMGGSIEIAAVTRDLFCKAYNLTQKDSYLLYAAESKTEVKNFYTDFFGKRNK